LQRQRTFPKVLQCQGNNTIFGGRFNEPTLQFFVLGRFLLRKWFTPSYQHSLIIYYKIEIKYLFNLKKILKKGNMCTKLKGWLRNKCRNQARTEIIWSLGSKDFNNIRNNKQEQIFALWLWKPYKLWIAFKNFYWRLWMYICRYK
jgi:hypothetical protein